jgi:hypothetical protein
MQVKRPVSIESLQIVADADRLTSRAGTALLAGLADRVGLSGALSEAMGGVRQTWAFWATSRPCLAMCPRMRPVGGRLPRSTASGSGRCGRRGRGRAGVSGSWRGARSG